MKLLLALFIPFIHLGCNDKLYTLNTCDLKLATSEKKNVVVKIISIDSNLNKMAYKKDKCYFYIATDIHQKDTFGIIDVNPEITTDRMISYFHKNYLFAFTPQTGDSCITCTYKQPVFYKKDNEFRLLSGKLNAMVQ